VRLLDRLYFGASLHRLHVRRRLRQPTRRDRVYERYGPSRRLIVTVTLLWLLVLVLLAHVIVLALHGPLF
jgi:hypothetical protein